MKSAALALAIAAAAALTACSGQSETASSEQSAADSANNAACEVLPTVSYNTYTADTLTARLNNGEQLQGADAIEALQQTEAILNMVQKELNRIDELNTPWGHDQATAAARELAQSAAWRQLSVLLPNDLIIVEPKYEALHRTMLERSKNLDRRLGAYLPDSVF